MISIVSTIYYAGRVLAIIDINGEYRTAFYRSSGSNVDNGEGMWFPFMGIVGPGLLKRTGLGGDFAFMGKISKDFIYTTKENMYRFEYILRKRDAHSDPKMRWNAYNIDNPPFDIEEVAKNLRDQYKIEDDIFLTKFDVGLNKDEIEFVNSWITYGLNAIKTSLE
jgi:hypothetical protein